MNPVLIHKALIINEGASFIGSVLIKKDKIAAVFKEKIPDSVLNSSEIIDASGKLLMPGIIDDHVHFREPGLTHKADIKTESVAAIAGGVTSFMEMPNTIPQTTDIGAWNEKMKLAEINSYANYAFYLGATNDNLKQILDADFSRVCGVKVFMGSSTGNMLVDNERVLEEIFSTVPSVIAVHAESEGIIQSNKKKYIEETMGDLPMRYHSLIRSSEACYSASARAVELASKYDTRLHILHISTAKELSLLEKKPLHSKKVTAEACIMHLWFDDRDYSHYGSAIKCNPAVKTKEDRAALRDAVANGLIDVVSTDHAPHLISEKQGDCITAASGSPSIQFSLILMLELVSKGILTKEAVVERMCHAPATIFRIEKRGFIREGYYADLVIVDQGSSWNLNESQILSKCGWSPFIGQHFNNQVYQTWLNGKLVYENGKFTGERAGMNLNFE
jgi:dihydroorotase